MFDKDIWIKNIEEKYKNQDVKLRIPSEQVKDVFYSLDEKFRNYFQNINPKTKSDFPLSIEEAILWRELTLDTFRYQQYCMDVTNNKYFIHRIINSHTSRRDIYSLDARIMFSSLDYAYSFISKKILISRLIIISLLFAMAGGLLIFLQNYKIYILGALFVSMIYVIKKTKDIISIKSCNYYNNNNDKIINNYQAYISLDSQSTLGITTPVVNNLTYMERFKIDQVYKSTIDFIFLCTLFPKKQYGLKSEQVDNMWHEMISDTFSYQILCMSLNRHKKRIVEHFPGTDQSKISDQKNYELFLEDYCKIYHTLPNRSIWPYFINLSFAMKNRKRQRYYSQTSLLNKQPYSFIAPHKMKRYRPLKPANSYTKQISKKDRSVGGDDGDYVPVILIADTSTVSSCCGSSCGGGCSSHCG